MDYLYIDSDQKKHIGTLQCVNVSPYVIFEIDLGHDILCCHLQRLSSEWNIYISEREISIELAHPTDIFWNNEAIYEKIKEIEISHKIAYAIKSVYEILKLSKYE